jgi:hypothetical protein
MRTKDLHENIELETSRSEAATHVDDREGGSGQTILLLACPTYDGTHLPEILEEWNKSRYHQTFPTESDIDQAVANE